ncbi:DNA cytosine methyltransferase [Vogesella sp. XCS3]|uniref:DNA cytosine methyltransferase n=1 Tax=Vogesella sp. XCS3 TaxID=2877939 RepID=UPI001D09B5A1|nr:DNA cytosine methyltransferase [Vogesella sp. XCS3]UDM18884.1 DNA cytosine methyltransferase [Vogesella sp. XCS3]
MIIAQANVPEVITKELQIATIGTKRKIRLSSNWLPLVGFEPGIRHSAEAIAPHQGIQLKFDTHGRQQVYQRKYNRRKNNPFETVIEIAGQALINEAIPGYTERVHFTLRHGDIIIRPLPNRTFMIRKRLKAEPKPFAAMVAMTSGIDLHCLTNSGFYIDSVLEYRPKEVRDKQDLTESGALNALANASPRLLINEDISTVDWGRVADLMQDAPQLAIVHISLQCDDFSTSKGGNLRRQAIENLTTSRDLAYDGLRMIETVQPACVMLEQVTGFGASPEAAMIKLKLRKWGYHVTEAKMAGRDYGGITRRERYYLIASVFPGFEMPAPDMNSKSESIWDTIKPFLTGCRDVSHTKSLQDGISGGRARLITPQSVSAPTLLKSQSRQAKDSIYIDPQDGRYLLPSLALQQRLNGIPDTINLSCVSETIASEIIGQSIEYPMHEQIAKALHRHIAANVGSHNAVMIRHASSPK